MAGLGLRHLQAIHALLRNRASNVPFNATWQHIHRLLEVGEIRGKSLHFTPQMLRLLHTQAECVSGADLLEGYVTGDRQAAARQGFIDEKVAQQRPDDQYVLLKGQLPDAFPALSPEMSLRVPIMSLDLSAIPRILLIENLDSFDHWQHYQAPADLAGCLVLYRGHGGLARGARRLLASFPVTTQITVFADYDPAGLAIAMTLPRADALLLPQLDARLLSKGSRPHFERQYRNASHLDGAELGQWQSVWAQMKQHGVSIKQQHMLALATPLQRVSR